MRGQKTVATVVRRPNGQLARDVRPLSTVYTGRLRKTPLSRGVIAMLEALVLGTRALFFSASVALEEGDEKNDSGGSGAVSNTTLWLLLAFSFALAVGLFFLVPLFLTRLLSSYLETGLVFNLVEGVIRLGIFLLYLWGVSFLPDIRRVFAYHGAEHKTIHAYEAGVELTPESVKGYSTAHARCGTAFLLAVMVIAILVFGLVGKPALWLMVLSRVVLLPLVASLAYEATQLGARHMDNRLVRTLMAPGLWLQSLTTRQPDEGQLEVAIAALKEALTADGVLPASEAATSSPQA